MVVVESNVNDDVGSSGDHVASGSDVDNNNNTVTTEATGLAVIMRETAAATQGRRRGG